MKLHIRRIDSQIYFITLLAVLLFAAIIDFSEPDYFGRFIGDINPLLSISLGGIIGFYLLLILTNKYGFTIFKPESVKKTLRHVWKIILFATIAIVVDCIMVFPKDLNIPFPDSLLFYPAIAFFVEIVFHVIPVGIILSISTAIFKNSDKKKLTLFSIILVALIEPTFQIMMDDYPIWALIITWVNLYLFNLFQLLTFKRYGFIAMYLFRLIYYLIWHILWGHFRLDLLF